LGKELAVPQKTSGSPERVATTRIPHALEPTHAIYEPKERAPSSWRGAREDSRALRRGGIADRNRIGLLTREGKSVRTEPASKKSRKGRRRKKEREGRPTSASRCPRKASRGKTLSERKEPSVGAAKSAPRALLNQEKRVLEKKGFFGSHWLSYNHVFSKNGQNCFFKNGKRHVRNPTDRKKP